MSGKSPSPHLPLSPSPPQPITVIMGIQPDMILFGRAGFAAKLGITFNINP